MSNEPIKARLPDGKTCGWDERLRMVGATPLYAADLGLRMVCVADLKEGDMVDLEGDPFADPRRNDNAQSTVLYECEYATVFEVERETPGCVRVDFDTASVGFPADHMVKVSVD